MVRQSYISRRKNRRTGGRLSARALVVTLLLPLLLSSATGWATTLFQCRTDGTAHVERCCGEEAAAAPTGPHATLEAGCCDARTFSKAIPAADQSVRHSHGPELTAGVIGSLPSEHFGSRSPAGVSYDRARQGGSGPPILLVTRSLLI